MIIIIYFIQFFVTAFNKKSVKKLEHGGSETYRGHPSHGRGVIDPII